MKLAKYTKFREEKFGAVLFETRSEKVYTLNPTGAAVVREIQSGAAGSPDAIVESLKAHFEEEGASIEHDVVAFIAELRSKGLLEG